MAIKIGGTTIVNDSRGVTNITSGVVVGVKSDGTYLGAGATTLNFVGSAVSIRAVDSATLDVIVSGGGGGGAIGISSNSLNVDPAENTLVGSGITHINFVGAGATVVGLTTAVVTVNKSLTIGRRTTAASVDLSSTSAAIVGLRDGSTASIPV